MRVTDDLRAAWQSLAEAESDLPGHDYDRGYLTGWYDVRRSIRRILPRGLFRDPERIAEWRKGYREGRDDGKDQPADWWPDHAIGRIDADGHAIPGSGAGEPLAAAYIRARLRRETAQAAAIAPVTVSVATTAATAA